MNEELQDIPKVLDIRVPLKSRIFSLVGLLSLSSYFLYLSTKVPKYGMMFGKDVLGVQYQWLNFRLSNAVLSYPLYALAGISFLSMLYLILSIKMRGYRLNHLNLVYKHGVITTEEDPLDLVSVRDQKERRSLIQRILGLSSVIVYSTDKTNPELNIAGIEKQDAKNLLIFINNYAYRNYTEYRVKKDLKNDLRNGKRRHHKEDEDYIYGDDGDSGE